MIVQMFIDLIHTLLSPIFSLLPTGHIPNFDVVGSAGFRAIAAYMNLANVFVPLDEILGFLVTVLSVVLPALAIYFPANWLYKHIPQIGGFGPGSG